MKCSVVEIKDDLAKVAARVLKMKILVSLKLDMIIYHASIREILVAQIFCFSLMELKICNQDAIIYHNA